MYVCVCVYACNYMYVYISASVSMLAEKYAYCCVQTKKCLVYGVCNFIIYIYIYIYI